MKKILVSLNKKIYSKKIIKIAVSAYEGLATLSVRENKEYYLVDIMPNENKHLLVKNEFCNYVLGLQISNSK